MVPWGLCSWSDRLFSSAPGSQAAGLCPVPHPTSCHLGSLCCEFHPILVTGEDALSLEGTLWFTGVPFPCLCLKALWLFEGRSLAFPDGPHQISIAPSPCPGGYIIWFCGLPKQDRNLDVVHFQAYCQKHLRFVP